MHHLALLYHVAVSLTIHSVFPAKAYLLHVSAMHMGLLR